MSAACAKLISLGQRAVTTMFNKRYTSPAERQAAYAEMEAEVKQLCLSEQQLKARDNLRTVSKQMREAALKAEAAICAARQEAKRLEMERKAATAAALEHASSWSFMGTAQSFMSGPLPPSPSESCCSFATCDDTYAYSSSDETASGTYLDWSAVTNLASSVSSWVATTLVPSAVWW